MASAPLVTVVIPCSRSYEKWLGDALRSCADQTMPVQVILVGYGLAGVYSLADRQIDVEAEFCLATAYNFGIRVAKTPYIICLDADNMLKPEYVERCLAWMDESTVVTPGWEGLEDPSARWLPADDFGLSKFLDRNLAITSAVFSKDVWEEVGGFRDTLYLDWDFWVRAFVQAVRFRAVKEPLLRYRTHNGSVTARTRNHDEERAAFRARLLEEIDPT